MNRDIFYLQKALAAGKIFRNRPRKRPTYIYIYMLLTKFKVLGYRRILFGRIRLRIPQCIVHVFKTDGAPTGFEEISYHI